MNGGNSAYHNDDNRPNKRQKTNRRYQHHNDTNNDNEVRDTSLPIKFQPTENTAKTIEECFGMYLSREQLGRDNKWYCKKCKTHVQGRKKLDLWWLPSHL